MIMSHHRGRAFGALALALAVSSCTGGHGSSSLPASQSAASADQRGGLQTASHHASWIGAWGAPVNTQSPTSGPTPSNSSIRDVARLSLGGSAVRIRIANPFSANPLVVGAATIALQAGTSGAAEVPGSTRRLTFGGKPGITLPAGTAYAYSDPVPFTVHAQQNVAVSLYLPGTNEPQVPTAVWNSNYASASGGGDATRDESGASYTTNISGPTATGGLPDQAGTGYALTGIDVLTTEANGAVVAFGSSTFQGNNSDQDQYDRVTDLLSVRIGNEIAAGGRKGIVNAGIGGDSLFKALARYDRDVASVSGVKGVMVYDINDISNGRTLDQIEGDYRTVVSESHARGIRVMCSTWAPEVQDLPGETSAERESLNAWLLNSRTCDAMVDWDQVLRDPNVPQTYNPAYFSDGIHPNATGHREMANAVPLSLWFGY